jgi:SAM-dependent methyltransferase
MRTNGWILWLALFAFVAAGTVVSVSGRWGSLNHSPAQAQDDVESKKIVPYVPTPQEVVDRMLELAQVKKGDVVYDLGSGDGRIVVTAAKKYGVKAVGYEIDPQRIKESHENIKKAGVEKLVEIKQQDIRTVDLSGASVLTMYLLPEVNMMLRPNIWSQMKQGSRVVSHDFDMGDWKPVKTEHIKDSSGWDHTLYFWRVEAKK